MAANEIVANRVRAALPPAVSVVEKKMFGGIAFMVNGKMCFSVGRDRLMFRIDPQMQDQLAARDGCRTMTMKGREYKGYIHVDAEVVKTERELKRWMAWALTHNRSLLNR